MADVMSGEHPGDSGDGMSRDEFRRYLSERIHDIKPMPSDDVFDTLYGHVADGLAPELAAAAYILDRMGEPNMASLRKLQGPRINLSKGRKWGQPKI